MRELLLLVGEVPPQASSPLLRIKVSNIPDENPIIGFGSAQLGQQFIEKRGLGPECRAVAVKDVAAPILAEARTRRVLLFESADVLTHYLNPHERFEYDTYIMSFEDAARRLQYAL